MTSGTVRGRAVVAGAGMAGLLAARVLADVYERVTVVDRDTLPSSAEPRRGVPQGRHLHLLLPGGAQVIEDLFPGFSDDLAAAVPVIDDLTEMYFAPGGHLVRPPSRPQRPLRLHLPSRAHLEWEVRHRVLALPNVEVRGGCDVSELTTRDGDRVIGVRVVDRSGRDGAQELDAQLVVDATGQGSRTPHWLDELGYPRPREQELKIDVRYASQVLRLPPGALREKQFAVAPVAGRPTLFALVANEDDTWLFTVAAVAGRRPPTEPDEMVDFMADFAPPHLVAALRGAERLTAVSTHHFPANRWRRYDRLRRFPSGLLPVGDAICSFNPIYGQGMSVAALEAAALQRSLIRGDHGLARRFFRSSRKPINVAWTMAVGADLSLPEVAGPRPLPARIGNAYFDRYLRACESDTRLAERFLRVAAMVDPPTRLFHPAALWGTTRPGRGQALVDDQDRRPEPV